MPNWNVHRFWSKKLGLKNEVSEEVDKIIDCREEFKGFKIGHDWIKGSIGRFVMAVELFYQEFGVEGVKAMMLHGVLDYMASLIEVFDYEEVYWRALAWVKFAGAEHVIHYVSRLPKTERLSWVLSQSWGYYNYFDLSADIHAPTRVSLKEIALNAAKELVDFVMKNFQEILVSLKSNSKPHDFIV
jgi:hypothetical protein